VLKKLGITAAIVTAGLLAVSPLAFAGDYGANGEHGKLSKSIIMDNDFSRDSSDHLSNKCKFEQEADGVPAPILGALPLPPVTQAQTLNCMNVNDIGATVAPTVTAPTLPTPVLPAAPVPAAPVPAS
jgi:hypothetical protein